MILVDELNNEVVLSYLLNEPELGGMDLDSE